MRKYIVAYKNDYTLSHTDNLQTDWVILQRVKTYSVAKQRFDFYSKEFSSKTVIALFISNNPIVNWFDTKPRYIHNSHVLINDHDVRLAFGELINSVQSGVV